MEGADFLLAGVLFLFAAVVAVPIAARLGIGAVLGYLLAGIAIGPWGLGFISDVDEILHFSELGVVFLMFIIGLELNPAKLWQLRRSIFGIGAGQVLFSALVLGGLLMLAQFSWQAAIIGGIGLAMSSTAMALQLMREKGMNRSESGQLGFSVLLFQDLAVIPAVALVPLLAGKGDEHTDWMILALKVFAFLAMLVGGRYLLRPYFALLRLLVYAKSLLLHHSYWCSVRHYLWKCSGSLWLWAPFLLAYCWRKVNIAMNLKLLSTPLKGCCWGYSLSRSAWRSISVSYSPISSGYC